MHVKVYTVHTYTNDFFLISVCLFVCYIHLFGSKVIILENIYIFDYSCGTSAEW